MVVGILLSFWGPAYFQGLYMSNFGGVGCWVKQKSIDGSTWLGFNTVFHEIRQSVRQSQVDSRFQEISEETWVSIKTLFLATCLVRGPLGFGLSNNCWWKGSCMVLRGHELQQGISSRGFSQIFSLGPFRRAGCLFPLKSINSSKHHEKQYINISHPYTRTNALNNKIIH